MQQARLGRYSFLMADPVEWFQPEADEASETFAWLDARLDKYKRPVIDDLPPFQGGIAGLFEYEFNALVEPSSNIAVHANRHPVSLGVYDVVLAWDHQEQRCYVISTGVPEQADHSRATERAEWIVSLLSDDAAEHTTNLNQLTDPFTSEEQSGYPCDGAPHLKSNFHREQYLQTIERALEYIHAGDIFQVNIAQQLVHQATSSAMQLYRSLRNCNPSTFAALFDTGIRQIISASPERLVSVRGNKVETRPIKGTRRRTSHPEVDIDVAHQLLASDKDRAENVMIVDLMRNDLSRICLDDSVSVSQFVQLESYASVLHLVSAIEGQLQPNTLASDLLRAVFPGGSITGAPKVRSMEIIAELEPWRRGPYCGSLGYFGFNGNVDLNILIRTITQEAGVWRVPVGGGIVADSDPQDEFEETWTKAYGMLKAIADSTPGYHAAKANSESLRSQP